MTTRERHRLQGPVAQNLDREVSSSSADYQHDRTIRSHVEHFQFRVVQDALTEATADYWLRRAEAFDAARPRRGEFHGQAGREALQARHDRLTETAAACRAAAYVAVLRPGELSNALGSSGTAHRREQLSPEGVNGVDKPTVQRVAQFGARR